MPNSCDPVDCSTPRLLCPQDFLDMHTGVGIFTSPGNLSNSGIEPESLVLQTSPALQVDSLLLSHQGSPRGYSTSKENETNNQI